MVVFGPGSKYFECEHCHELVRIGHPDSHSNRCGLFGGHSEELCRGCRSFYRPPKGWNHDQCPRCATT